MNNYEDAKSAARERFEPSELAVARLSRRAAATLDRPRPSRRPMYAGFAALSVAAAALLFALRPTVTVSALAADTATTMQVSDDVALSYAGRGEVTTDGAHPRVSWELGTLDVEVTPNRGVDLVIETPEATVRVIGTGFTVARDALGSAVDVRHGIVAVRCGDGREGQLTAGQSMTCLPVRAAGMLARAKALAAGGAADADVLVALDAGLRLDASPPVRAELSARRIRTLSALGRDEEAAAAASAWLAGDETIRRAEVEDLAFAVAMRRADCATATRLAKTEAQAATAAACER
jgi:ferric-dicitrate binding protein FerR (iron transport regulator)